MCVRACVTLVTRGRVYLAACYAVADVGSCQLFTGRQLCATHRTGDRSGRRVGGAGLTGQLRG